MSEDAHRVCALADQLRHWRPCNQCTRYRIILNLDLSSLANNGGVTAALRASLGRPEPFTLRFVEIGNEVGNHSMLFYHRRSSAWLVLARLMLVSDTGLHWLCSVDVSASDAGYNGFA